VIFQKLSWALANRTELEFMSSCAKKYFLAEYNWEKMSQNLVEVYRRMDVI
jgi:glycosyltransferase involved in cell wall biosynthesis